MFKINTSIIYLTLILSLCIIISCNKTERDKNILPENKFQTDSLPDSEKKYTEPLKDTVPEYTNKLNEDSLRVQKQKEKKNKNDSLKVLKEAEVKILAYYFHPTARCVTCRNIEAYSYEAIQQWEENNKINIVWKELNIEDSVNEHYVDEYSLQFSSLVIIKFVGGKKEKWKNLEDTWKLVNDKNSFIKYVKHELNQFVKSDMNGKENKK